MPRLLVIDDLLPARAALCAQLAEYSEVAVVGVTDAMLEARTLLAANDYDAVFINITLHQGRTLELLPRVRRDARVVFVAPKNYLPPAQFDSLGIEHLATPIDAAQLGALLHRLEAPAPATSAVIAVKSGSSTRLLRLDEIRCVASRENYTEVSIAAVERAFVRRTMQQWIEILPPRQFARVHRGLIVNLDRLGRVERLNAQATQVHFTDEASPPLQIKRRHWPALRLQLDLWRTVGRPNPATDKTRAAIAVLPFANLSDDRVNDLFCDGISEELLNVLAQVPRLRVSARTSAFRFKGTHTTVSEIARQLGVDYIVDGSVRKAGRNVRITARLVNAADGFQLWSDNFHREIADIFAVQDEIAREIALRLQLELVGSPRPQPVVNPQAHGLVLEGRHYWNLRTNEGFVRAEAAFTRAIEIDPAFAAATAGLADLCVVRAMYRLADGATDTGGDLARAKSAAQRALELDPTLGEPHATLGFAAFHEGDFATSAREFPRAFEANPNYATGYQFYAWSLCARGLMARALLEYEKAIALDPLSFINLDRYAAMLFLAGRPADALTASERAVALRPDGFVGNLSQRAPILLALGRRDEAVDTARTVRRLDRDRPFRRNSDADGIYVLRSAGFTAEAESYAAEVLGGLGDTNYLRGFILSALGDFASALPALRHTPAIMLPQLYWSPLWEAFRATAEFSALITGLGREAEYRSARAATDRMALPSAERLTISDGIGASR